MQEQMERCSIRSIGWNGMFFFLFNTQKKSLFCSRVSGFVTPENIIGESTNGRMFSLADTDFQSVFRKIRIGENTEKTTIHWRTNMGYSERIQTNRNRWKVKIMFVIATTTNFIRM